MQLPLPGPLSPALERLRAAIANGDPPGVDAAVSAALTEVDTPIIRAGLVRAVQWLWEAGRVSDQVAAAVTVEQASPSPSCSRRACWKRWQSASGRTTPSGLLVVSRS